MTRVRSFRFKSFRLRAFRAWLTDSLTGRLFAILFGVSVVLAAFGFFVTWTQYREERAIAEQGLEKQALTVALLIDREFDSAIGVARLLATSGSLSRGDLGAFQNRLDEVQRWSADARDAPQSVVVAVFDKEGRAVASAGVPRELPLPARSAAPGTMAAIRTGQMQILDLFRGSATGQPQVGVAYPVFETAHPGSPVTGVVMVTVPRQRLLAIAMATMSAPGVVVTVRDRNLVTVARSLHDAETLGRAPPPEPVVAALREHDTGLVYGVRRFESDKAVAAYSRAPISGFTVTITVPNAAFLRPLLGSLKHSLLFGTAALGCAIYACAWFSRQITATFRRSVMLAEAAAAEAAVGGDAAMPSTGLREADRLGGLLLASLRERDAAAARALDSERWVRAITEASPLIVWSATPEGERDFHNQRWFDITGATPEQSAGHGWLQFVHPADRDRVERHWSRSVRCGEAYETEYRLRTADGSYRWMLGRAIAVHDAEGRAVRWHACCVDFHDVVLARESQARDQAELERLVTTRTSQLKETEARLAHAARLDALGKLAGGIAHDFNNILQAISANAMLTMSKMDQPAAIRKHVNSILGSVERGASITGRLLTFSRQSDLENSVINVEELLASVADMLRPTLGGGIDLQLRVAPGLPRIVADANQLETVLVNLATNARDALEGTGAIVIAAQAVRAEEAGGGLGGEFVGISVIDRGCGMDAATLARAREPFFTTKPFGKGTGLGLAMAHGFAEQSGGGLEIQSVPGVGTTVSILLPTAALEKAGGLSVLVVDGDGAAVAGLLREAGHAVEEVADEVDAEAAVGRGMALDAVVAAVALGEGFAASVRRRRPGAAIVFLAGPGDGQRPRGERIVERPVSAPVLRTALSEVVAASRIKAQHDRLLGRMAARIRDPMLLEGLGAWQSLRGWAALPSNHAVESVAGIAPERSVVAEIDGLQAPVGVYLDRVGSQAGRNSGATLLGGELPAPGGGVGEWEAAYRDCVRLKRPTYESLRVTLPNGASERFERLLLPFVDDDGRVVTIVGMMTVRVSSERVAAQG